jgi:hypothetical protein
LRAFVCRCARDDAAAFLSPGHIGSDAGTRRVSGVVWILCVAVVGILWCLCVVVRPLRRRGVRVW